MQGVGFAVEVPGAANPLTYQGLCRVLQSATSHDNSARLAAGEQLKTWEDSQGYLSSLQSVFLDKPLPIEIRFQAIIQLKNNIDKTWRLLPHVRHGVSPQEKALIRSRLFEGAVREEEKHLALHSSLVAAKIVRIDFPSGAWPTALGELVSLLRTYRVGAEAGSHQFLGGALQILLRATKELASVRIRKDQSVSLQTMAPEITFLLAEIYSDSVDMWTGFLTTGRGGNEDDADQAMINSIVALKTIRRLIMVGFDRPHHDKTVQQFWNLTQTHFGLLLGLVSHDSQVPAPYQTEVGKHLLQFTKFHIEMSFLHPASFATLPNSLHLVHSYWDLVHKFSEVYDESGGIRVSSSPAVGSSEIKSKIEGPLLERLALKGLLLLRACIKIAFQPVLTFKYRSPEVKEEQRRASALVKEELLKPELVIQITNALISRLFVFRKADLEAWEASPEEWEQQEQSESSAYEWEVRPCAQKLFLDLLTNFRDLLVPPLMSYFNSAARPQSDVATKEAVYTAMGLAAPHLRQIFDFDALLSSTIVHDAQQQGGPLCKVLRRRIAITVSEWVAVDVADSSRPLVYELFRHLMNPDDRTNDEVVRITAARQLKWIVDDIDFKLEAFLPYAEDALRWMVRMVQDAEIDETRLAILESVRLLVTRLESQAARFGDFIMSALPRVWVESGPEEFMIKQAVIAIFSALVAAMGQDAQVYHPFMLPLLREAASAGTALYAQLVDEALELWNTILVHSNPPLSPDLVGLAPLAFPILEFGTSTASQALEAVESYLLLAPRAMLQDDLRVPLVKALGEVVHVSKSRDHVRLGTICIQYLVRSASDLGGSDGLSVTLRDLMDTGFLPRLLERLHGAYAAGQTTGPNRKHSELSVTTQGDYFAILARVALADPAMLVEVLASLGGFDRVWPWLSEEWFAYNANCDSIERQKLSLLALTRLLELPARHVEAGVLSRLQEYFTMWASVIVDLQDGAADASDTLVWGSEPVEVPEYMTCKSARETEVARSDPVRAVNSLPFVNERLQALVARVGDATFRTEWAANIDKEVLDAFQALSRVVP